MSQGYVPVNWNRRKQVYDLCLWAGILLYVAAFIAVTNMLYGGDRALPLLTVLLRATSTCAFVMLTLILCIGPLARMDRRYLPLLYNRRHFGVSMFVVALVHGLLAIYWVPQLRPGESAGIGLHLRGGLPVRPGRSLRGVRCRCPDAPVCPGGDEP